MVTPDSSQSLLHGPGLERFDRDGELPYWAELWPASVGMARSLMRGPDLSGQRVLDLGCGLGLAGIAAGCRGAFVLFADREPEALRFAAFNARHNGVQGVECLQLDWHRETAPGGFDLLCLADVAYEEKSREPLLRHLSKCLRPGGRALVGDPYREVTGGFLDAVSREFQVEVMETDTFFAGRRTPLRLVWIRHP
jgi:predicted nicotinamide N-methyase